MTHTPGPWTADNGRVYTDLLDDNGDNLMVATCRSNIRLLKEKKRNAVIMAASLEMLEVLEWLSNEIDCRDDEYGMVCFTHDDLRKVKAAIKKARGE